MQNKDPRTLKLLTMDRGPEPAPAPKSAPDPIGHVIYTDIKNADDCQGIKTCFTCTTRHVVVDEAGTTVALCDHCSKRCDIVEGKIIYRHNLHGRVSRRAIGLYSAADVFNGMRGAHAGQS